MYKKNKLYWKYYENSDCFFIDPIEEDYGFENEFIHVIGEYKTGTIQELRDLLENSNHFLWNVPELEKLVNNDIEQF